MKALAGRFAIIRIVAEVQLLLKKLDCGGSLLQQVIEIERLVDHGELSVGVSRPVFWRPVTIEFKAATIRVAKIQRFGNAMVRSSIKRNASVQKRECSFEIGYFQVNMSNSRLWVNRDSTFTFIFVFPLSHPFPSENSMCIFHSIAVRLCWIRLTWQRKSQN